MPNIKLLLNAVRNKNLNEVKKAIEDEKTDINADLTQGRLGSLSYYTPTILKAVWSDSQDNLGYRALHWAARLGHLEILDYLCSRGADINATNYIGNTPLHVALYFQQSHIIKALVERQAKLNMFNSGSNILGVKEQFAPLHYAVLYGKPEDVRLLLENGALVSVRGSCGLLPLHLAMRQPDIDKISMLINYSANINAVDSEGKTPLHHAVLDKTLNPEAIKLLVRPELNLEIEDDQGNTVIDLLLENIQSKPTRDQLVVLELLLHVGADYERFLYKLDNLPLPKLLDYFNQYLLTKTKQFNLDNKEKIILKNTNIHKDLQNDFDDGDADHKIDKNHPQSRLAQGESNKIELEAINQSKTSSPLTELANSTAIEKINNEKLELGVSLSLNNAANQQKPIPIPPPPPPAKGVKPRGNSVSQSNNRVTTKKTESKPKSVQESMMDYLKNHPKFKAVQIANLKENNTFNRGVNTNVSSNEARQFPGLTYLEIPGDGHCLYRAVSYYLSHGEDIQWLRNFVAAHIEHNIEEFSVFLQPLLKKDKTILQYLEDIRNGKEWADNIEIEVLMRILNRPILIIRPNKQIKNPQDIQRSGEPIFVYYNDHNHYDALLHNKKENLTAQQIINRLTGFIERPHLHHR